MIRKAAIEQLVYPTLTKQNLLPDERKRVLIFELSSLYF